MKKPEIIKRCGGCRKVKSAKEFYVRKDGSLYWRCKICCSKINAKYQKDNPEKINEYRKRYYKENTERCRRWAEEGRRRRNERWDSLPEKTQLKMMFDRAIKILREDNK